ncbi:hypothetical protein [Streptomyces hypolithicus]
MKNAAQSLEKAATWLDTWDGDLTAHHDLAKKYDADAGEKKTAAGKAKGRHDEAGRHPDLKLAGRQFPSQEEADAATARLRAAERSLNEAASWRCSPSWLRSLPRPRRAPAGFAIALLMGIVFPCVLYAYFGALLRLRRMRKVMRLYAWELRGAARRLSQKQPDGVPVQLRTGPGDDDWSEPMRARNPLRWNRWSAEMENGAWFAGDPAFGGVIALPGGGGLMSLGRGSRLSFDQFRELSQDAERFGRARDAGIGRR